MRSHITIGLFVALFSAGMKGNPGVHASRTQSITLWASAWNGDAESVSKLLRDGADPNWRNTDDDTIGHTSVHAAARRGNVDVLDVLLKHKDIDPCVKDSKGATPLKFAVEKNQVEAANRIKEYLKQKPCEEDATEEGSGGWFSSWFGQDSKEL